MSISVTARQPSTIIEFDRHTPLFFGDAIGLSCTAKEHVVSGCARACLDILSSFSFFTRCMFFVEARKNDTRHAPSTSECCHQQEFSGSLRDRCGFK